MLNINLVTVGKIKEDFLQKGINEYKKRISKFAKLNIISIKEDKNDSIIAIKKEEKEIMKYLSKGFNIILDINSQQFCSKELAAKINKISILNSTINFVIGSSHGLSDKVKQKADLKLSFSKMTFPHQLFQLIVLEQIYRALSINNNGKYHK